MMMDSNSLKLSFYKESICSEFVIFYDILQDVHKALTLILYTINIKNLAWCSFGKGVKRDSPVIFLQEVAGGRGCRFSGRACRFFWRKQCEGQNQNNAGHNHTGAN